MYLNKKIKFIILGALSLLSSELLAKDDCNESEWSCHNPTYLIAGYVIGHYFHTNKKLIFSPPDTNPIYYTSKQAYPNNLSGMRLGFGSKMSSNSSLDYEIAYNQLFNKTMKSQELIISTAIKSLSVSVSYPINPQDRLTIKAFGGAAVGSRYLTRRTVQPMLPYSEHVNGVDVNPYVGMSFVYHINARFAGKIVVPYEFSPYSTATTGLLIPFFMLVYYPK